MKKGPIQGPVDSKWEFKQKSKLNLKLNMTKIENWTRNENQTKMKIGPFGQSL